MPRGFLPNADSALLRWSQNCRTQLLENPGAYGVPAEVTQSFSDAIDAYGIALLASRPDMRSVYTTTVKNSARTLLRAQARTISALVQAQTNVTDAEKIRLGLNVRAPWTPIPAPIEKPVVMLTPLRGNRVQVELSTQTAGQRGKPRGVASAAVFSNAGETNADGSINWRYEGARGKTKIILQLDPSLPPGTVVSITAHWLNPRSQSGPMADPRSTHLLPGVVLERFQRAA